MSSESTSYDVFVDKAVGYLSGQLEAFAAQKNDSELRRSVAARCAAAMDAGMQTEAEIITLVDFGCRTGLFGENGPEDDVVAEVLAAKFLDNETKLEKLRDLYAQTKAFEELEQENEQ